MSELKKMKSFYTKVSKTKPPRSTMKLSAPVPQNVSKRLVNQLAREANKAWGIPRNSRTRVSRFGMIGDITKQAKKVYSSAKSSGSKAVSRVSDINRSYGRKADELLGGRISSRGNIDFALPATIGGVYLGRKTYKGLRSLTSKAYRAREKVKKLEKESKRLDKQVKRILAREEKVRQNLEKSRARLEKIAEKAATKSSRRILRGRGSGMGTKSTFRPVIYSPTAARSQQALVVPCGGGWWN